MTLARACRAILCGSILPVVLSGCGNSEIPHALIEHARAHDGVVPLNVLGDEVCMMASPGTAEFRLPYKLADHTSEIFQSDGFWFIGIRKSAADGTVHVHSVNQLDLRWDFPTNVPLRQLVRCNMPIRIVADGKGYRIVEATGEQ